MSDQGRTVRSRGAVEREFGRLKREWALLPVGTGAEANGAPYAVWTRIAPTDHRATAASRRPDPPVHSAPVAELGTPLLRRAFDRAERAVGAPLERAVQTRTFADAVAASVQVQRAVWRLFDRNTRTVLHLCNVPARTDVEHVNRQVAALRNELHELAVRFGDAGR